MRTRKSSKFACRVLRRGDRVAVQFATVVEPGKVVEATRKQAVVRLLKVRDGHADEHSFNGEVLIRFVESRQVDGERGLWTLCGLETKTATAGVVYNGYAFHA